MKSHDAVMKRTWLGTTYDRSTGKRPIREGAHFESLRQSSAAASKRALLSSKRADAGLAVSDE